ncbi:alpha/beta-hydrolase [Dichomitus squalens LYAD-421 SS1]|uniref:Carboxylic ester hydrolase n=1 Tax=Dichomitus squalens (strain LYAD-421) TaxID=732165 RepID=R7SZK3_DICSQ|nr:alpha/beta-hydrolase [Dichomitus squalens LYAD-421 SS1]EJF61619.1 alpha/beta-hydrolase [Dichomitus squalens LYAD-421 SS1]
MTVCWPLQLSYECLEPRPLSEVHFQVRGEQYPLSSPEPTVQLDNGSVIGLTDDDGRTNSFRGLRYAKPPVAEWRFQKPQAIDKYTGVTDATSFGNTCYNVTDGVADPTKMPSWVTQEMKDFLQVFNHLAPGMTFSEDCLNLDVIVPATGVSPGHKLPVVVYIPFSAFMFSGSTGVDGRKMVKRSIELGEPIIFVALNHRMGPFGFLPGQEALDNKIGNLGLYDQRQALRWIHSYIPQFGGDEGRVTLLGLSAGGVSAASHMIANNGDSEQLYHGVWAESGAIQPVGWMNESSAQSTYSNFVKAVCGDDVDVNHALPCLRNASVEAIREAAKQGAWQPLVDGEFLKDYPQHLHSSGAVAPVPIVAGNANEEGALFAADFIALPGPWNYSTAEGVKNIIKLVYYPDISDSDLNILVHERYPDDPELGVPYGTGDNYQHVKGWKRLASLLGDIATDAVRRKFVQTHSMHGYNDTWSYIYRRHNITGFGCTHGSEIDNMYEGGDMADRLIWFANNFNPNRDTAIVEWPKYQYVRPNPSEPNPPEPTLLEFSASNTLRLIPDTYREHALELVMRLNSEHPWPV